MTTIPASPIYIDLDDVLCDTAGAYIALVKTLFGKEFRLEDIHSFNLRDSFQLTAAENDHMFRCAHAPEFSLAIEPFADIVPTLNRVKDQGHRIAIVTGRHTSAYHESLQWLHLHEVPFDSFTMVDKYGWPDTDTDIAVPLEQLTRMQFSLAIEDNPAMASHLHTDMNTRVLIYDRPWNREIMAANGMHRCHDWRQIGRAVSSLSGHTDNRALPGEDEYAFLK